MIFPFIQVYKLSIDVENIDISLTAFQEIPGYIRHKLAIFVLNIYKYMLYDVICTWALIKFLNS